MAAIVKDLLFVVVQKRQRVEAVEDGLAFPVAAFGYVVDLCEKRRFFAVAENIRDLPGGPEVKSCLPLLRNPHRRMKQSRHRARAWSRRQPRDCLARRGRAAGRIGSPSRPPSSTRSAARCRRASSRNAARASAHRPNSARSRRRYDRRCLPGRYGEACSSLLRGRSSARSADRPSKGT